MNSTGYDENFLYYSEKVHTMTTGGYDSWTTLDEMTSLANASYWRVHKFNDTRGVLENCTTTFISELQ